MRAMFHPRDRSSRAMFYHAHAQIADRDQAFTEMLNNPANPLTPEDVDHLVARDPARYGRYAGFGTKKES